MRTKLLAGYWNMNKRVGELAAYFDDFSTAAGLGRDLSLGGPGTKVEVLFAAPYTLLAGTVERARPLGIQVAAQNVHWEAAGAFTGEVALGMLAEIGVKATLIGHSERRQFFGEVDETVAKKVKAALAADFLPIACVGETLAEREGGRTTDVVTRQVRSVLQAALPDPGRLVVAYEPVWAIGTGRSATAAQAQEVHALIRRLAREQLGPAAGDRLRLLYGGSATPQNIDELLAQPDIDGGLVGGASLKPADFARMVRAAR
jgi:triosephosphate isomerase